MSRLSMNRLLVLVFAFGWLQGAVPLPVKKIVLYKNGVGYFQHLGSVQGDETVQISLPSDQLDDVLKSLTVLDLDGGTVSGITYESIAPLSRRLQELPIDPGSMESLVSFLNSFRGAQIELDLPSGKVEGRLLAAEARQVGGTNQPGQVTTVTVFTSNGELKLRDLESIGELRFQEPAITEAIGRFLAILNSRNQQDVRQLSLDTRGAGERRLFVSYTSEVPIWKTTYRIVLGENRKPLLQGWAIVDNTTPMPWPEVELSLVSGAPVSFVHPLSQPVYGRRPVVPLPEGVQVTPQTHEGTLEEKEVAGGVPGGVAAGVGASPATPPAEPALARQAETFELSDMPAKAQVRGEILASRLPAALDDEMRRADFRAAIGGRLAEQFEYRMPRTVTIGQNQSALLPILQIEVDAEKVSIFNPSQGSPRPRLAVWLRNNSGLTLDGGAFTVLDSNALAGEGLMETIQPAERRLLSYAVDLGIEVQSKTGAESRRVERVVIQRGVLRMARKLLEQRTYTIRNSADSVRVLLLEHPVRNGWKLVGTVSPEETSASYHRFRFGVGPGKSEQFVVREEFPQESVYQLTNLTNDQLELWIRDKAVDAEIERALRPVVEKKSEFADLDRQIAELNNRENAIFQDQQRLRDNLSRLSRSPEEAQLRQRYLDQLAAQEDQLGQIRTQREVLQQQREKVNRELVALLEGLDLERTL